VIDAEKANHPVVRMVDLLGVSRSGYYAWAARRGTTQPGPRAARRADLTVKIKVAHDASDGVNGAPRIVADLRAAGEVVSRKTVAKLMRANEIRGISPRPWRPVTTIADANPHAIPDLVERRFDRGVLNAVWTSDITYLATGQGWLYLCAVRDGCSRRVIGYAFADSLHTDVVETALRRAVTFRDPAAGSTAKVIFHADRGCQYTSSQLATVAEDVDVRLSVGRTGVCWDNAQQESFWSTLKTEYYQRHTFDTHADATRAVSSWIENVYNRRRRHSALGQVSPVAFEDQLTTMAAQAA
jgi:transposase InsO family protein